MVVPHLLVAVRFRFQEGSGTKSTARRPKNRASFQVSLQYVRRGTQLIMAVLTDVLGLWFLASARRNFGK